MFGSKDTYIKYNFPRVIITGSHICCGFRPVYVDSAIHNYREDGAELGSPYGTRKAVIFGMCYFSKFYHLHQYANRVRPSHYPASLQWVDVVSVGTPDSTRAMFAGGSAPNYRYWLLSQDKALLFTHQEGYATEIRDYITKNNLGEIIAMPSWKSKVTFNTLETFLWFWNGTVPTPESANIRDFPFDMEGTPIPGRTNLRNRAGYPVFPPGATAPNTPEVQQLIDPIATIIAA